MSTRDRRAKDRRKKEKAVPADRRSKERRSGDRREGVRVPLELWMEEVSGEDVYFRRTGNVGGGGVYFDRAIPHALGTVVTLKFALPGEREMVIARGEVVSTATGNGGLGMGVKFISIEGNGKRRLRDYIRGT
jgi:hypothetical protein